MLQRRIPGTAQHDLAGPYPIFCCADWSRLQNDLDGPADAVSAVLVTDPLGDYTLPLLRTVFPDIVIPYKDHFVTDLTQHREEFVSEHHRRYTRRSLRSVVVERCEVPAKYASTWVELYSCLVRRHSIRGFAAFSEVSLRRQLEVPGLEMLRAVCGRETVAIALWIVQNNVVYYHLAASNDRGYCEFASFALMWTALELFATSGARWMSLGGGAGLRDDQSRNLARFKRGWSTGTRTAYLCGRIFDRKVYEQLTVDQSDAGPDYFPAYRRPENSPSSYPAS